MALTPEERKTRAEITQFLAAAGAVEIDRMILRMLERDRDLYDTPRPIPVEGTRSTGFTAKWADSTSTELAVHCPKCQSSDIVMSVHRGGAGRLGDSYQDMDTCKSCGYIGLGELKHPQQ